MESREVPGSLWVISSNSTYLSPHLLRKSRLETVDKQQTALRSTSGVKSQLCPGRIPL